MTSVRVALIAEQRDATNLPTVAIASVAAYLASKMPDSSIVVQQSGRTPIFTLEKAPPQDVIVVWSQPELTNHYNITVSRLNALHPNAVIVVIGPSLVQEHDATLALSRHPWASATIRGEAEQPLVSLCQRCRERGGSRQAEWQKKLLEIPGVSVMRGGAIDHGPPNLLRIPSSELPSPFAAKLVPDLDRPTGECCVEVVRGPIPFSPLRLEAQFGAEYPPLLDEASKMNGSLLPEPGSVRVIPPERLRSDLQIVLRSKVPVIRLESRPLDIFPGLLQWVTSALESLPRTGKAIHIELGRLPGSRVITKLRGCGVTHITLTDPDGRDGSKHGLRAIATRLRELNTNRIHTTVRVPIGRDGMDAETIRRHVDVFMRVPVRRLEVEPRRIWPGDSSRISRDSVDEASRTTPILAESGPGSEAPRPTGMDAHHRPPFVATQGPPYQVLSTNAIRPPDFQDLELWGRSLKRIYPRIPYTLRELSRVCGLSPSMLSLELVELMEPRLEDAPDDRRLALLIERFIRIRLERSGKTDRIPVFRTLARFESWCHRKSGTAAVRCGADYSMADLNSCVLVRMPGQHLRTFDYDVLALKESADPDCVPWHRTHVVLRKRPELPPIVERFDELERALFTLSDGHRTVSEIQEGVRKWPGAGRASEAGVREQITRMLEREILYVKRVEAGPAGAPGRQPRKILPFLKPRSNPVK